MWNCDGEARTKPSKMQKDGLDVLRVMKQRPSELEAHYRDQPHFLAREIVDKEGAENVMANVNFAGRREAPTSTPP